MACNLEIIPYEMPKADLDAMPDDERALLFLLGHASNEIVVLQKLLIMATKGAPSDEFVDHIEAAQGMIILRLLVGKLHEAWELLRTRCLSNPSFKGYADSLDDHGRRALNSLKRHFGQGSPISELRNDVCFHYPSNEAVQRAYASIPNERCVFYLSQHDANTCYLVSETMVNRMLALDLAGDLGKSGLKPLFDVVLLMARNFAILFGKLIVLICEQRLRKTEVSPVELNVPDLGALPYFVDPASLRVG